MDAANTPEQILQGCKIRRFHHGDADQVVRLVRAVYGDTYYPPALYDPDQIIVLNEAGRLVSVLATNDRSEVIGHYALEPFQHCLVAEASDAIVAVDYRHHHLLEEMRVLLREEANRIGLTGLVGYPVTNHLFSQKAEEHFGSFPCGIAPGLWPRTFHNMPEPLTQRMSFIIYFKYLCPKSEVFHAETSHSEILARIAAQWNISVRQRTGVPVQGVGEISVEHETQVQVGTIRVNRVGTDSAHAIRENRAKLLAAEAMAICLELPLAQAGTAELCRQAEAEGFFFTGLGPAFAKDGDALLLQYLAEDVDMSLIQVANPFAKELLDYVSHQRDRSRTNR